MQIAEGIEPDPDHVDRVLNEANKTLDDLRRKVEQLQRRQELRKKVDRIPDLLAERREIEKQIKAADQALDDAEERHTETTFPSDFFAVPPYNPCQLLAPVCHPISGWFAGGKTERKTRRHNMNE